MNEAIHLEERHKRSNLCFIAESEANLELERVLKREKLVEGYHQQKTETLCALALSEEERNDKLNRAQRLHELQISDFDKLSEELLKECKIIPKENKDDQILDKLQLKVNLVLKSLIIYIKTES